MLSYLSPNYIVGTSGRITFSGLAPRRYELRVSAVNNRTDEAKRRRRFEISDDPTYCTTHLINDGVTINGDNVTVEFAGIGSAASHLCKLDRNDPFICKSLIILLYTVSKGNIYLQLHGK